MTSVPCNGCTACCHHDQVFLHPEDGDRPERYETVPAYNPLTGEHGLALRHKKDGSCWYVGEHGCTIHGKAPKACRDFDCRLVFKQLMMLPRPERRRLQKKLQGRHLMSAPIMEAAKARMHTLTES